MFNSIAVHPILLIQFVKENCHCLNDRVHRYHEHKENIHDKI